MQDGAVGTPEAGLATSASDILAKAPVTDDGFSCQARSYVLQYCQSHEKNSSPPLSGAISRTELTIFGFDY